MRQPQFLIILSCSVIAMRSYAHSTRQSTPKSLLSSRSEALSSMAMSSKRRSLEINEFLVPHRHNDRVRCHKYSSRVPAQRSRQATQCHQSPSERYCVSCVQYCVSCAVVSCACVFCDTLAGAVSRCMPTNSFHNLFFSSSALELPSSLFPDVYHRKLQKNPVKPCYFLCLSRNGKGL